MSACHVIVPNFLALMDTICRSNPYKVCYLHTPMGSDGRPLFIEYAPAMIYTYAYPTIYHNDNIL